MGSGQQHRVVRHAPITAADLPRLRALATEFALAGGVDEYRAAQFATAVSEIATNSILHAAGTGAFRLVRHDALVYAEITDTGPGMPPSVPSMSDPAATNGRGLWISRTFTDRLRVRSSPAGTTVRMELTISEAKPPEGSETDI